MELAVRLKKICIFSQRKAFIFSPKKAFLIFQEMKPCTFWFQPSKFFPKIFFLYLFLKKPSLEIFLIFSQMKAFLIFLEMEPCTFRPKLEK